MPTVPRLRNAVGSSIWLLVGLGLQAATTYLTLILVGRLLGAALFGAISALYVLLSSVATGLFLPLEQEIARRRGVERTTGLRDPTLITRTTVRALTWALAVDAVALAAYPITLRILGGQVWLLAALSVALPGYACCFVSRGSFAGSGALARYGIQLSVEGIFRLIVVLVLTLADTGSVVWVGWTFAAAPWTALVVSLVGYVTLTGAFRHRHADGRGDALGRALGLLLVSSLASQLLVNAGPVVVQLVARPSERASAGAFLAALVVVRVPVFLYTAVQPSFLPAMAAHAAADRRTEFLVLTRRVLVSCAALTIVSTALLAMVGPPLIAALFQFPQELSSWTFAATGVAVGLFLAATIMGQALLGRGRHAAIAAAWLVGIGGLVVGTAWPADAVGRATHGFLLGSITAVTTFSILLARELRNWVPVVPAPSRPE